VLVLPAAQALAAVLLLVLPSLSQLVRRRPSYLDFGRVAALPASSAVVPPVVLAAVEPMPALNRALLPQDLAVPGSPFLPVPESEHPIDSTVRSKPGGFEVVVLGAMR
jgi:hypothetical protein